MVTWVWSPGKFTTKSKIFCSAISSLNSNTGLIVWKELWLPHRLVSFVHVAVIWNVTQCSPHLNPQLQRKLLSGSKRKWPLSMKQSNWYEPCSSYSVIVRVRVILKRTVSHQEYFESDCSQEIVFLITSEHDRWSKWGLTYHRHHKCLTNNVPQP